MRRNIILSILFSVLFFSIGFSQKKNQKKEKNEQNVFYTPIINDIIHGDTTSLTKFKIDTIGSKFNKALYNFLIKDNKKSNRLEKNDYFNQYSGRIIDSIIVINNGIYISGDKKKFVEFAQKIANAAHMKTKAGIIRRLLPFKVGESVSPNKMILGEAILTNNNYIANANIVIEPKEDNSVNVYVLTRDHLSINGQVDLNKRYESSISIMETNLFGIGHNLSYTQYFNRELKDFFRGFDIGYEAINIYANYIDAKLVGGYGDDYYKANIELNRNFITKGDFAGGFEYDRSKFNEDLLLIDTFVNVEKSMASAWFGKSFNINKGEIAPYFTAKYDYQEYHKRPFVSERFNPKFQNHNEMTFALGLYKESFYRGNLIYGYGLTEQIPYGYKFELVGGYKWGEFYNTPYIGTNLSYGHNFSIGYLRGEFNYGTYIKPGNKGLERSIYRADLRYFSNLLRTKNGFAIRYFFDLSYITGTNLLKGEGTSVIFSYKEKRHYERDRLTGSTRLLAKPEMVAFTPYEVLGFKLVGFSFLNIGTIGNHSNPFLNKFFCEMGLGIRLKNENFLFKNIEIKIVIGLKNPPGYLNPIYSVTTEPRLNLNGFMPKSPSPIIYK